jgi:hypothetical protein
VWKARIFLLCQLLLGRLPFSLKPVVVLALTMTSGALTRVAAISSAILAALIPSFLGFSSEAAAPRKLQRTSYLDGLRGVAALCVVIAHYEATYFPSLNPAWHASRMDEEAEENIYAL